MPDLGFDTELTGSGANTRIDYGYRDEANYKQFAAAVLKGRISAEQIKAIAASLDDGEFFIPGQVGLDDLQGRFEHGAGWRETDHVWHTIGGFAYTDAAPTLPITVDELMRAWPATAGEWDVAENHARLSGSLPRPSRTM